LLLAEAGWSPLPFDVDLFNGVSVRSYPLGVAHWPTLRKLTLWTRAADAGADAGAGAGAGSFVRGSAGSGEYVGDISEASERIRIHVGAGAAGAASTSAAGAGGAANVGSGQGLMRPSGLRVNTTSCSSRGGSGRADGLSTNPQLSPELMGTMGALSNMGPLTPEKLQLLPGPMRILFGAACGDGEELSPLGAGSCRGSSPISTRFPVGWSPGGEGAQAKEVNGGSGSAGIGSGSGGRSGGGRTTVTRMVRSQDGTYTRIVTNVDRSPASSPATAAAMASAGGTSPTLRPGSPCRSGRGGRGGICHGIRCDWSFARVACGWCRSK
jgi:hypothetical protein